MKNNTPYKTRNTQSKSPVELQIAELNAKFKTHKENPLMEIILSAAKNYISEKNTDES